MLNAIRNIYEDVESRIESGPIYPAVSAAEIRAHLESRYDFAKALDLETVLRDVETMLAQWQVQVTHPRYFGLFNPSVTLASVVADTLVALYNPQLANWRTSPAANEIERHTLAWLAECLGLPSETLATFTSGGTEANLSAGVVALTHRFPEYGNLGLQALQRQPVIYITQEAHNGYNKLAHATGLGRSSLRLIATDSHLRMDPADLQRAIYIDRARGREPLMVVATAGTTATGIIDPLDELAALCADNEIWLHVDAAWGGAVILSDRLRPYLSGIEAADSVTFDAHKWLSVTMGAGMFFCRHPESVSQAFRTDITYMPTNSTESVYDPLLTSLQWSRRFIGLKLFLSLAERGREGYAQQIEHQVAMGDLLRRYLLDSGWRVLNETPLPLVCFTRDGLDVDDFLAELRNRQIAWMTSVRVAGVPAIRACITSYRTSATDVIEVVEQMNQLVANGATL